MERQQSKTPDDYLRAANRERVARDRNKLMPNQAKGGPKYDVLSNRSLVFALIEKDSPELYDEESRP